MKEHELGFDNFPTFTTKSTNRKRFFLLFVFFVLLAAILGGLFMLGSAKQNSSLTQPGKIIEATATPLPTSSASAVLRVSVTGGLSPTSGISALEKSTNLNRSKLNVAVLNGSGEKGAGATVASYLEGLGYKIARIGNADTFSYKNLVVLVKKDKGSYAGLLKKDLQANPSFASVSASVSDDIENEAEVIVGK